MPWRIINLLAVLGLSALVLALFVPLLFLGVWSPARVRIRLRGALFQTWARSLVRVLGIRVCLRGPAPKAPGPGLFLVSNHLGYLDILILASVAPLVFVSRHDVADWPVIGFLARAVGTIFVDREQRFQSRALISRVARELARGANVLVFPEGTSTAGRTIRPFHTALFEAPRRAGAPIQPLTLRYLARDGRDLSPEERDAVCWYDGPAFPAHVWRFLGRRGLGAEVTFAPRLEPVLERKELARETRRRIRQNFRPLVPL